MHGDAFLSSQWSRVASLAIEAHLPSNSTWGAAAEAGVLFSYGPNLVANHRRAAGYVAAILKGAKEPLHAAFMCYEIVGVLPPFRRDDHFAAVVW